MVLVRLRLLEEVAASADADVADAADARRLEPAASREVQARSSASTADATLRLTPQRRGAVVERRGAARARREEQRWERRVAGHRLFRSAIGLLLSIEKKTLLVLSRLCCSLLSRNARS